MASKQVLLVLLSILAFTVSQNIRERLRSGYGASPSRSGTGGRLYSQEKLVEPIVEEIEIEEAPLPVRVQQQKLAIISDDYAREAPQTYTTANVRSRPAVAGQQANYAQSTPYRLSEEYKLAEEQAKSAKYSFASAVDDGIMDQSQVRQETRDGLKVSGSYSYSDGYFKRTVNYEADENGYRVISEETEPIGDGPQVDLVNGKADIHSKVEGVDTIYSISAQDIALLNTENRKVLKLKDY